VPTGELPEIALLHTQVHTSLGARDHHAYAPSELTWLCHAGYDYWALGHVHIRQQLSADPPIWYPGSLQGKSHTDTGARGALLVDLSDREAPLVSFRPLAPVRWDTIEVDRLDDVRSLDDLEHACLDVWNRQRAGDPTTQGTEWMVRIVLQGPCPLWAELRTVEDQETLASELAPMMGALEVVLSTEGVHATLDLDEHRQRTDILGEALRLATEIREGRLTLENLDATSLARSVGDDPNIIAGYVRSLLGEAEGELAMRLLDTEGRR
jgi:DNA repair exonuclease SbcCD nuclease subunit